jgi:dolichol kinase
VLKELMEAEQTEANECIVVADDRNNASIFLKDMLKIGYNPDFVLRVKADKVVTGGLAKLLPIIRHEKNPPHLPSKNDLFRELIHSSGFFIPVIAAKFGIPLVGLFIVLVVVFYSISELARIRGNTLTFFSIITRKAASPSELCHFTFAPIYFGIGILLTLLLFPLNVSSAAIAIFTLGDSTASIIGGTLSKKPLPLNHSKTWEGTFAGLLFSFLAATLFVAPWIALVGAIVGMIVEFLPLPINDNLIMPLCAGIAIHLLL